VVVVSSWSQYLLAEFALVGWLGRGHNGSPLELADGAFPRRGGIIWPDGMALSLSVDLARTKKKLLHGLDAGDTLRSK